MRMPSPTLSLHPPISQARAHALVVKAGTGEIVKAEDAAKQSPTAHRIRLAARSIALVLLVGSNVLLVLHYFPLSRDKLPIRISPRSSPRPPSLSGTGRRPLFVDLATPPSARPPPLPPWSIDRFWQPGLVKDAEWFSPVTGLEMPLAMKPQTDYAIKKEHAVYSIVARVFNASGPAARSAGVHRQPIFVDSGSNDGFWSLLAARHGITAVAVEPQLRCLQYLAAAAKRNDLPVHLHHHFLSPSQEATVAQVRTDDCWGATQILRDGSASDEFNRSVPEGAQYTAVTSVSLDTLLGATTSDAKVLLWHIDTEGAEVDVLQSGALLFAQNRIDRVLIEWLPSRWHKFNVSAAEGLSVARRIFTGWQCRDMCKNIVSWAHARESSGDPAGRSRPGSHCDKAQRKSRSREEELYCVAPWIRDSSEVDK